MKWTESQPKSNKKIYFSFKLYFNYKSLWDTATRSFVSCHFLLAFTSTDITFHKFLEPYSTLSDKMILVTEFSFFNGFIQTHTLPSLLPLNDQNPLSVTKVFCWCSLNMEFLEHNQWEINEFSIDGKDRS